MLLLSPSHARRATWRLRGLFCASVLLPVTPACADGALLVATARVCLHSPPRTHTAQKTALYRCVEMGFFEVVQVLLDHKADPNIQETGVRLCAGGRVWGLRSRRALSRAFARFFQLDYVA